MRKEYYFCDTRGCNSKSEAPMHKVTDTRKAEHEEIDLCHACYDAYLLGGSIYTHAMQQDIDVATKNTARLVSLLKIMPDDEWSRIYGSQGLAMKKKLLEPEDGDVECDATESDIY
jgi:hypothetical protein